MQAAKTYNSAMKQIFIKPLLSLIAASWLSITLAIGLFITLATSWPFDAHAQSVAQPAVPALGPAIVLNSKDASLSLIDQTTYAEIGRVDVGKEPHHLYPSLDGKQLIVANATSNDLHYIDPMTGKILRLVRNIDDPYQLAFSPDQKLFVSIALRLDRVDIYRTEGANMVLAKRVPIGKAPSHVWISKDSKLAFVTLQDSNEIAAIDLLKGEVAWKMAVGKQPAGILVTPDDKYLMVGIMGEDYVQVIDWRTRQTVKKIVTGKGAHNFRGLGDKRHVFVSNRVDNRVTKVDMQTMEVVEQIPVMGGPDCMEVTADGKFMWVTSRWAKRVSVINLAEKKVIRQIEVGRSPHGIYLQNRAPIL
jgi:DNA-binding beta-propeller fold protein YncE